MASWSFLGNASLLVGIVQAADGHVNISTTNELGLQLIGLPQSEESMFATELTSCSQLRDSICKRNDIQHWPKTPPVDTKHSIRFQDQKSSYAKTEPILDQWLTLSNHHQGQQPLQFFHQDQLPRSRNHRGHQRIELHQCQSHPTAHSYTN